MFHVNKKNTRGVILISDKADFRKRKKKVKYKEEFYVMTNESVLQEDIKVLKVDVPNNRESKYMKQKL